MMIVTEQNCMDRQHAIGTCGWVGNALEDVASEAKFGACAIECRVGKKSDAGKLDESGCPSDKSKAHGIRHGDWMHHTRRTTQERRIIKGAF